MCYLDVVKTYKHTNTKGQSYGIFISQLVRYARINSSFSNFILDCKKLVSKLINQCFSAAALRKRFEAFIDKHFYRPTRLWTNENAHMCHVTIQYLENNKR